MMRSGKLFLKFEVGIFCVLTVIGFSASLTLADPPSESVIGLEACTQIMGSLPGILAIDNARIQTWEAALSERFNAGSLPILNSIDRANILRSMQQRRTLLTQRILLTTRLARAHAAEPRRAEVRRQIETLTISISNDEYHLPSMRSVLGTAQALADVTTEYLSIDPNNSQELERTRSVINHHRSILGIRCPPNSSGNDELNFRNCFPAQNEFLVNTRTSIRETEASLPTRRAQLVPLNAELATLDAASPEVVQRELSANLALVQGILSGIVSVLAPNGGSVSYTGREHTASHPNYRGFTYDYYLDRGTERTEILEGAFGNLSLARCYYYLPRSMGNIAYAVRTCASMALGPQNQNVIASRAICLNPQTVRIGQTQQNDYYDALNISACQFIPMEQAQQVCTVQDQPAATNAVQPTGAPAQ